MSDPLAQLPQPIRDQIIACLESYRTQQSQAGQTPSQPPDNLLEILKGTLQDPITLILTTYADTLGNTPQAAAIRALAAGLSLPFNALIFATDYIKGRNDQLPKEAALSLAATKLGISLGAGVLAGSLTALIFGTAAAANPWSLAVLGTALVLGLGASLGANYLFGVPLEGLWKKNWSPGNLIGGAIGYAKEEWPATRAGGSGEGGRFRPRAS